MGNVGWSGRFAQGGALGCASLLALVVCIGGTGAPVESADPSAAKTVAPVPNPQAEAKSPAEMKKYTELLAGTDVSFDMVPIPGGEYVMGSPDDEPGRGDDESPQHKVRI